MVDQEQLKKKLSPTYIYVIYQSVIKQLIIIPCTVLELLVHSLFFFTFFFSTNYCCVLLQGVSVFCVFKGLFTPEMSVNTAVNGSIFSVIIRMIMMSKWKKALKLGFIRSTLPTARGGTTGSVVQGPGSWIHWYPLSTEVVQVLIRSQYLLKELVTGKEIWFQTGTSALEQSTA